MGVPYLRGCGMVCIIGMHNSVGVCIICIKPACGVSGVGMKLIPPPRASWGYFR